MKKTILIISILFTSNLFAQSKNYKSFYQTHKTEDSVIGISVPIKLASLFIEDDDVKKIIKNGKKVRILVFEEVTDQKYIEYKNDLSSNLYERLLYFKNKADKIEILVREDDEIISEVILFIRDKNELVTVGVFGKFDQDDLAHLQRVN